MKHCLYSLFISFLILLSACSNSREPLEASRSAEKETAPMEIEVSLSDYRWKNRILVFVSPTSDDQKLKEQLELWKGREAELADRDLLILQLIEKGESVLQEKQLRPQSADQLRRELNVTDGESLCLLIGKDGGVKLREQLPVDPEKINALIDSMPMRQQEMRN